LKGIGVFVLLLLTALGVGTFLLTREPSHELDAQGRTWVADFSAWHADISRPLGRSVAATSGLSGGGLSAGLAELLSACAPSLAQLGSPPDFLHAVVEDANAACGQIEVALSVDAQQGSFGRATTWDHLHRAEGLLAVAKTNLRLQLDGSASDSS
jgi:hypothetical protein